MSVDAAKFVHFGTLVFDPHILSYNKCYRLLLQLLLIQLLLESL